MDNVNQDPPERSDHEIFRQSIAELDRIAGSSWRSTIAQIVTVLTAVAAPFCIGHMRLKHHFEVALLVNAILLMLVLQSYDLTRHNRTKLVRDRLAKQLQVTVKQRIRADRLYGLSILDPLTGLHNRRFGEERLKKEIARSEQGGDPLAVILFDLDYFKQINDQFGHAAGDAALKEFSRKLKRAIRACDVPVRIGGDEFLVILPDCPREKVDIILPRIGSPEIQVNCRTISIRYSVGRAHYQISDTTQTLLQRADKVLYAQKAARRGNSDGQERALDPNIDQAEGYQKPLSLELKRRLGY
jgi:diguanylate cyclase (GGDEF)-like protein